MENLIIGANSFLGRELCQKLFDTNDNVIGVFHNNKNNLLSDIINISIEEMFNSNLKFDFVYLVSAYIPSSSDIDIDNRLNKVNVEFVKMVCKKFYHSKIIYCSTVSIYKESDLPIFENSKIEPNSIYGKSKYFGEKIIMTHPNYSIVRISSMYGVGMKEITFLPAIINNAIDSKNINLLGDGSRRQNYVSVGEVATYLIESSKKSNVTYLATNSKSYSNLEIAEKVKLIIGDIDISFSGEDKSNSYYYDNSFTRNELKIKDNVNFTETLKELITWQIEKF